MVYDASGGFDVLMTTQQHHIEFAKVGHDVRVGHSVEFRRPHLVRIGITSLSTAAAISLPLPKSAITSISGHSSLSSAASMQV
jgi:hypothetical protein